VGSLNFPIIIVMAVITTAYATYGGLLVSIVTDQIQAIVTLILVIVLSIYVWATFKQPLPTGFGDLAPTLGPNESGYGAIFVMPVSLLAATIFNEGMWQRVWAAEDERALKRGSLIGCIAIVVCVFLFGLFGFLAAWGGLIDFTNTNINLYLFQIFKTDPAEEVNSRVDNAIEVVTLILGTKLSLAGTKISNFRY
jgi:SSS family solute:Na+ symporter